MRCGRGAFGLLVVLAVGGCRNADADAKENANARVNADADAKENAKADAKARRVLVTARVAGIGYAGVSRGREVVSGGVGVADQATRTDASADTVFEAASIAKTVIATCVMQLVEEGRLDLDSNAETYVGFPIRHPGWKDPVTLRMLLTHRASIRERRCVRERRPRTRRGDPRSHRRPARDR